MEGGEEWGGSECAEYRHCCQGEAWSTGVFCNGCSSPQRSSGRWEQGPFIINAGSVRCELIAPGDMVRAKISGT